MLAFTAKSLAGTAILWAMVCLFAWKISPEQKVVQYRVTADSLPMDDEALKAWLLKQPDAVDAAVVRNGKDVKFRFVATAKGFDAPAPPWNELGYTVATLDFSVQNEHQSGYHLEPHTETWRPFALLACLAVAAVLAMVTSPKQEESVALIS